MTWSIYVLFSEKWNQTYVGCASDVSARLVWHNAGRVRSTRHGRPWRVIYQESLGGYREARQREKYLKSSAGRKTLRLLIGDSIRTGGRAVDCARLESVFTER